MTDPAGRRVSMTASKRKSGKLGGKGKGKGGRYDEEVRVVDFVRDLYHY